MKRFGLLFLITIVALSVSLDANAQRKKKKSKGDVEVVIPCTGPEYDTDTHHIRATGTAISSDMMVTKKKCMAAARAEIAMIIETKVKAVTDSYITSYQMGEDDDTKQRFQEMTRQSAKQTLNGVRVICDKVMRTPEGKYRGYITLELSAESLIDGMADSLMNDDKMRVDFEYEKFKEIFDEEMNKLSE